MQWDLHVVSVRPSMPPPPSIVEAFNRLVASVDFGTRCQLYGHRRSQEVHPSPASNAIQAFIRTSPKSRDIHMTMKQRRVARRQTFYRHSVIC
jgi:hypothetical protein